MDNSRNKDEFLQSCNAYVESVRANLGVMDQGAVELLIESSRRFLEQDSQTVGGFIAPIVEGILNVAGRSVDSGVVLTALERETIELAADWLEQLAALYAEDIPEPKALIRELLYTFELVEKSQEATTLNELLNRAQGFDSKQTKQDPFSQDPDMVYESYKGPICKDLFEDDPGFGIEFDLLQRTFSIERPKIPEDIFTEDETFDAD